MRLIKGVVKYFQQVRQETLKVTWPTREQTIRMTALVIIVSVALGALMGGLDYVLAKVISAVLQRTV